MDANTSPLRARALPARRVAVGMVVKAPEAAVRTRPVDPKDRAVIVSRTIGAGAALVVERRQRADRT